MHHYQRTIFWQGRRSWPVAHRLRDRSYVGLMSSAGLPLQKSATIAFALILLAAGCTQSGPDWRVELIEISQSEHAAALHYEREIDDANVDAVMRLQCSDIESALSGDGATSPLLMYRLRASADSQIGAGVPVTMIERDLAALELAMAATCPTVHDQLVTYFGFSDFTRIPRCRLGDLDAPGTFCQQVDS